MARLDNALVCSRLAAAARVAGGHVVISTETDVVVEFGEQFHGRVEVTAARRYGGDAWTTGINGASFSFEGAGALELMANLSRALLLEAAMRRVIVALEADAAAGESEVR